MTTGLVPFTCPTCGAIVYTLPSATVGHFCKHVKGGRTKFVPFERKAA